MNKNKQKSETTAKDIIMIIINKWIQNFLHLKQNQSQN